MREKRVKPFATEVDLCAAFLSVLPDKWVGYAETAGWDILLTRKADGFQVGVQAKLQLNAEVIAQCIEEYGSYYNDRAGPDCRAVLVPFGSAYKFQRVANYIGFTILGVQPAQDHGSHWQQKPSFHPNLPGGYSDDHWHEWFPSKRHTLPDYVPDVVAGAPAPNQLTDWKIRALRLMALIEIKGFVTRADFKHLRLDHRRWLAAEGWLQSSPTGFVACERTPNLKAVHPRVYEEIKLDAPKWMEAARAQGQGDGT